MAGNNQAFKDAGYAYPGSLVEVAGLPLIQRVIGSVLPSLAKNDRLIFCIREEENRTYHIGMVIRHLAPDAVIIEIKNKTQGAACTVLLAIDHINTDEPLLIINGDQLLDMRLADALDDFRERDLDGGIIVFDAVHPRWSYVRCSSEGYVIEAAEKKPISKSATAGVYYYKRGKDFVAAAVSMIKKDAHEDGLFYVCPVYNEMVLNQARIGVYSIDRNAYFSLKNPQGVHNLEESLKARKAN
jgi:dTDP-glucose pyrophosphorylase